MSDIRLDIEVVIGSSETDQSMLFQVKACDESVADIKLFVAGTLHTLESWRAMSVKIEEAIKMLDLKE